MTFAYHSFCCYCFWRVFLALKLAYYIFMYLIFFFILKNTLALLFIDIYTYVFPVIQESEDNPIDMHPLLYIF